MMHIRLTAWLQHSVVAYANACTTVTLWARVEVMHFMTTSAVKHACKFVCVHVRMYDRDMDDKRHCHE